jgi:hypothetical protein
LKEIAMTINQFISGPLGHSTVNGNHWKSTDVILKAAYLSLQLIDLGLTIMAARLGFPELNPFMRASLSSPYHLAIIKVGIPLLIGWLVPGKLLIPAIVLLGGILGWNIKELMLLVF